MTVSAPARAQTAAHGGCTSVDMSPKKGTLPHPAPGVKSASPAPTAPPEGSRDRRLPASSGWRHSSASPSLTAGVHRAVTRERNPQIIHSLHSRNQSLTNDLICSCEELNFAVEAVSAALISSAASHSPGARISFPTTQATWSRCCGQLHPDGPELSHNSFVHKRVSPYPHLWITLAPLVVLPGTGVLTRVFALAHAR